MTNYSSPSPNPMRYSSSVEIASAVCAGVTYRIRKMSLSGRMDMVRLLRDKLKAIGFHQAGTAPEDVLQSSLLGMEVDEIYLQWGLASITGLEIDGAVATAQMVAEGGPEALSREIVNAVKAEVFLSDAERKNY